MSDTIHAAGTILDTLPSSEELLGRRAAIVRELAPLRALYGGNGYMGERMFKVDEARVAVAIRTRLREAGEKTTEPQVDALTRVDEGYVASLATDLDKRARWVELEERLNEIDWRLRNRASDSALLAAEMRLTPS